MRHGPRDARRRNGQHEKREKLLADSHRCQILIQALPMMMDDSPTHAEQMGDERREITAVGEGRQTVVPGAWPEDAGEPLEAVLAGATPIGQRLHRSEPGRSSVRDGVLAGPSNDEVWKKLTSPAREHLLCRDDVTDEGPVGVSRSKPTERVHQRIDIPTIVQRWPAARSRAVRGRSRSGVRSCSCQSAAQTPACGSSRSPP